jgi:hypothetical protein
MMLTRARAMGGSTLLARRGLSHRSEKEARTPLLAMIVHHRRIAWGTIHALACLYVGTTG